MELIPFHVSGYLSNPHYQTIASNLFTRIPVYSPKKKGLLNETAVIPTQCDTGDRILLHIHRYAGVAHEETPVVVLVHGLEGSSQSAYMIRITDKLLRAGFHVIRMNMRSCGGGVNLAYNLYNGGLTLDVETVLAYARDHISPHVGLLGFSLGGNITLKYMGEDRAERNRQLAVLGGKTKRGKIRDRIAEVFVAISPPLDMQSSCEKIDAPSAWLYRNMFLKDISQRVIPQGKFDHIPDAHKELPHVKTWFEFDHLYVAPSAGFLGAPEYHINSAARYYIRDVETPGLVLHSRDDPIINPVGWDETNWEAKPHITAELTEHGGHVGWRIKKHPFIPDRSWLDYRIMSYLLEWRDSLKLSNGRRIFGFLRRPMKSIRKIYYEYQ